MTCRGIQVYLLRASPAVQNSMMRCF